MKLWYLEDSQARQPRSEILCFAMARSQQKQQNHSKWQVQSRAQPPLHKKQEGIWTNVHWARVACADNAYQALFPPSPQESLGQAVWVPAPSQERKGPALAICSSHPTGIVGPQLSVKTSEFQSSDCLGASIANNILNNADLYRRKQVPYSKKSYLWVLAGAPDPRQNEYWRLIRSNDCHLCACVGNLI